MMRIEIDVSFYSTTELVLLACRDFGLDVYEHRIRSQMKRDYPLNLSILIRGGKETN